MSQPITIVTNDAAQQQLQFVVMPREWWIVKDRLGNELGNIGIDQQVAIIDATLKSNPAIAAKFQGQVSDLENDLARARAALQAIVNYTESGSFIGNLEGCKKLAKTGLR